MDLVLDELPAPVFVDVDAARLPVVDLAVDDRRVGPRLHLEARDAIVVDVTTVKVTLQKISKVV